MISFSLFCLNVKLLGVDELWYVDWRQHVRRLGDSHYHFFHPRGARVDDELNEVMRFRGEDIRA